ncbi:MAG: hypothetical protein IJQ34_07045 [Kiritimatiellae bacterium]|nr:hypothetical protein [Kiritimatiellia bacterium]
MKEIIRDRIGKFFTILIVLVLLFGGLFSAWPAYLRGRSLKVRDERLSQKIEEKKREIAILRENQQRFKTDSEFIETIARQNKRVFPTELVFVFEDNEK